jgi:predicted transposase/invertase (TIGR01784 family)
MDLRVDYAFKLFFTVGGTHRLISLLNTIFENKKIPRVISRLAIVNPALEKAAIEDKLSILDIRAELDDGSTVCIEMHLYDLTDLKYKSVRSWARVYGEELEPGQKYAEQNPVICIAFTDGPLPDGSGNPIGKVHSIFNIMERDSHEILIPDLELHFINMKAFIEICENMPESKTDYDRFTKWLMLITSKAIENKGILEKICAEGEMRDAMDTLVRLSRDKINRQAYQRRLDELNSYNRVLQQIADKDATIAEDKAIIAGNKAIIAENKATIAENKATIADKDATIAEDKATIADKDATIADKDKIIAELMARLDNKNP